MPREPIDVEAARLEELMWRPTGQLRWRRPSGASDANRVLEQLFERHTGERSWRAVGTFLED